MPLPKRNKNLASVLNIFCVIALFLFNTSPLFSAVTSVTHSTQSQFEAGTVPSELDTNETAGDIKLKRDNESVTDTTTADFKQGRPNYVDTTSNSLKLRTLNKYNSTTMETGNYVLDVWVDETTNFTYISGYSTGLYVVDGGDPEINTDDELVAHYSTTSTPALPSNEIRQTVLDHDTDYLYISTKLGLSVVDTKGTTTQADDTLEITYSTTSSPALAGNWVYNSYLDKDSDILYISINGEGLNLIDTQGTKTVADDTFLFAYTTGSTPATAGNGNIDFTFDDDNDLLYIVSWDAGVNVIDTKGTDDPTDDENVFVYSTASTPAVTENQIYDVWIDFAHDLLYVSDRGGLDVINRMGTVDPSDDQIVITYSISSTPQIGDTSASIYPSWVYKSYLDTATHLLYVSSPQSGLSIIDTKNTISPADDTLYANYSIASENMQDDFVNSVYLNKTTNQLYFPTGTDGVIIVNMDDTYASNSNYISDPKLIASTPVDVLTFNSTNPTSTATNIQYRTGDSDAVWKDDFDDGDTSNVSDLYSWEQPFEDLSESDGILTMSGLPDGTLWAAMWIDTGKPANYFPAGSIIKAKLKVNTDAVSYQDYLFTDEWEGADVNYIVKNDWVYVNFIASDAFSSVGLEPYWDSGWEEGDSYQIDYITIELPDSEWNSWSSICEDMYGCEIDPTDLVGNDWIQYKLNLSTTNYTQTPTVGSVTYASGYQSSGTYTSSVITAAKKSDWDEISANAETPEDTTITLYTRSGSTVTPDADWSDWEIVGEDEKIMSPNSKYLQYRAILQTDDDTVTPVIHSITVDYDTDTYGPTGSISIEGGDATTTSRSVTLTLAATDTISTVSSMRMCNNESFSGCSWRSYDTSLDWNLTTGLGEKEVFAQYKDNQGNMSIVYSDTIELVSAPSSSEEDPGSTPTSEEPDEETETPTTPTEEPTDTDNSPTVVSKIIMFTDENGDALKNQTIVVNGTTYQTDAQGRATIAGLQDSNTVEYSKDGTKYSQSFDKASSIVYIDLNQEEKSTIPTSLFIVAGVVLLLIVGLVIYFATRKNEQTS